MAESMEHFGRLFVGLIAGRRAVARAIKLSLVAVFGLAIWSCGDLASPVLPDESLDAIDVGRFALLARLVPMSASQIVDEE